MKSTKLLAFILSSTLPIPFLYVIGIGYYEGMLDAVNLSIAVYPLSLENALVRGYIFLYLNWKWLFAIPIALIFLGVIYLAINSTKEQFHKNPGFILKTGWAIREWFEKYHEKDTQFILSAAKTSFLVVYFGLVLLLIVLKAHEKGKEATLKKLAEAKCILTDEKGILSMKNGVTVELKHHKKPIKVYVLMQSEKFISYYTETSTGRKSVHTVPMAEVKSISFVADILSDDWGSIAEKGKPLCSQ